MTTNGLLLARCAADLAAPGLQRVTVSLDALNPETFRRMNGRGRRPDEVLAGIGAARASAVFDLRAALRSGTSMKKRSETPNDRAPPTLFLVARRRGNHPVPPFRS